MSIAVVPARIEHRTAFLAMCQANFVESNAVVLGEYDEESLGRIFDKSIEWNLLSRLNGAPGGTVLMALDDEKPVGVIAVMLAPIYFAPKSILAQELFVYCVPTARGRGVAKLLFGMAADWARSMGCTAIVASALKSAKADAVGSIVSGLGFEALEPAWLKRFA